MLGSLNHLTKCFYPSPYLSLESIDGVGGVGDSSLSSVLVDERVGAADDALGVTGLLAGEGVVGVALLELKVVRHGRLVLRRSGDDHGDQAQGGDEKDLEKQGVRFGSVWVEWW